MSGTRGGAVGIVQIGGRWRGSRDSAMSRRSILAAGRRKSMLSIPGIAGSRPERIRQFDYEVPPGAAVILHSDG